MDVFIYLPPNLGMAKDEIEDDLEASLGDLGEVTGGGIGNLGMSVDLNVADSLSTNRVLAMVRESLHRLGVLQGTISVEGTKYPV